MLAIEDDKFTVIDLLIENGAYLNSRDKRKETILTVVQRKILLAKIEKSNSKKWQRLECTLLETGAKN